MNETRRRLFLLAACAVVAGSLGAQPIGAPPPVVGRLGLASPDVSGFTARNKAFFDTLHDLGYRDGQSVVVVDRYAAGDMSLLPKLARELIERRPTVIVSPCGPSLRAIRDISQTVPVVAPCSDEKNFYGEVASLARPGGYTTGVNFLAPESVGKRLEFLRQIVPGLSRLPVLQEPNDPIDSHWRELERLQPTLGISLLRISANRGDEVDAAFEAAMRERAQAIYVLPASLLFGQRQPIAELALKHRIATASEFGEQTDAGGLFSYGADVFEWYGRTMPLYVNKILKGAKPGELPIVQPTRFELVVNLKTAKAIGITIPKSILVRADRIIE